MGLGEVLDELACGVGGHIWVQHPEHGVMVCTRCGAQDDTEPIAAADLEDDSDSIIPEHRPWLEPPFIAEL